MRSNQRPIGVFDSGFGGLTVVSALKRQLPHEQLIYLGDTARLPYGTKSERTVIHYTRQIVDYLRQKDVKYLVAACNTASALGVPAVKDETPVTLVGVVEPGARLAAGMTRSGAVGVLGTLSTVNSGAYQRSLHQLDPRLVVHGQACPLLVPLVEEGWTEHAVTRQVVRTYLIQLRSEASDLDTLVLGCTHYPLLKGLIAEEAEEVFGHAVQLIDSAEAVAETVAADLSAIDLLYRPAVASPARDDLYVFTDANRFDEVAPRFLGHALRTSQQIDL